MLDVEVDEIVWGMFMSAIMKATVHLAGQSIVRYLAEFDPPRSNGTTPWTRSTLLHDRAVKLSKARINVHSDSVLSLGKIHQRSTSIQKWKDQI